MEGLRGDPISNRKVPMDANIIGALLGSFLRCDPENHAYMMPHFRLQQMVDFMMPSGTQFQRNKIFHGTMLQANLVENISILYSLCMYLLVTPNINAEGGTIFNAVKVVQATMSECLIVMHNDPKQQLLLHHPYTLFASSSGGDGDGGGGTIIESFRQANHVCKDIIRDMVKQLRTARDPNGVNPGGGFREKYDCWQAHSMYYMCGMGLLHFGLVAASTSNLNAVPGMMESMLLIACLNPKPYATESAPQKGVKKLSSTSHNALSLTTDKPKLDPPIKFSKDESTRFYLCFEFLLKCGKLAVQKAFNGSALQEQRMSKRIIVNAAIHPDCEYARLKCAEMKVSFLGVPSPSLVEDETALHKIRQNAGDYLLVGTEGSKPDWYSVRPKIGSAEIDLDAPVGLDGVPSRAPTPNTGRDEEAPVPIKMKLKSLYGGDDSGFTDDWTPEPVVEKGQEEWRKTKNVFARAPRASSVSKHASSLKGTPSKAAANKKKALSAEEDEQEKEIVAFWNMNKNFRPAYFSTRCLRRDETVLPKLSGDFHPKYRFAKKPFDFYLNPKDGLSKQSKQISVKNMVSIYYHEFKDKTCPRVCNPSQGMFWVATLLIDYVYQATFFGGGFNKEPSAKGKRIKSDKLMADMALEANGMRNGRGLVAKTSPDGKKISPKKSPQKGYGHIAPPAEELDIFQKLQLVAKEARTACNLDTMERELRNERKIKKTKGKERIKNVDKRMREGTHMMRTVATEQSDIYQEDSDDMYSDTDDSDDYTDTESESDEEGDFADEEEEEEENCGTADGSAQGTTENSRKSSKASSRASSQSEPSAADKRYFLDATDPFVQLALMQADNTNDKGQVMGEISNMDPLNFYTQQPALKDINKFRKALKKNGLVAMGKNNLNISADRTVSVVWTPEIGTDNHENVAAKMGIGKLSKTEQAKQYVEDIRKIQKMRAEELVHLAKEMEDVQEMEVSKSRAFIAGNKHEERERRALDKLENASIVAAKLEEKKRELKQKAAQIKQEHKRKLELETVEKARIADIVNWKQNKVTDEQMVQDERKAMEAIRLRKMESEKEYHEILQRIREEARMKYLEEKRRFMENKDEYLAAAAKAMLKERRAEWKKEITGMHTRVRDGAFHAVDGIGTVGYYDNIRPAAVDWVQFEDENGVSYYYDPVLKITSYDYPVSATVHHHTVDDRIAHDAIHGVGSYDATVYNEMMIASVNENGGYFNHEGSWEEVNGFYDENGRFWDLNIGYFDNAGTWVLYPEVTGTLDFMV